jgi:hypothetical protein
LNPEVSFVFIYLTTKEQKFKGAKEHAHEVDVILPVKKGKQPPQNGLIKVEV